MKHKFITTFLREHVSDQYAFFWQVHGGRTGIVHKAGQRMSPLTTGARLEEVDYMPPFLVLRTAGDKSFYAPLRTTPTLHRTFCQIEDDGGIRKFALAYGMLGFARVRDVRTRDGQPRGLFICESMQRWKNELFEMQRLVHLWDLVKGKKGTLLSASIKCENDGLYMVMGRKKELIAPRDSPVARRWTSRAPEPGETAIYYLTNSINRKIAENIHPRALPGQEKRVYLSPVNLVSAMWLMFLWEVIGETRPRQCLSCGNWFDPRRITRKTCGDRCRKRLSRQVTR